MPSEPIFLNSVVGDDLMREQVPGGRVGLKKARLGVTSGRSPLSAGLHPSLLLSPVSSLLGDGCLLLSFSLASRKMTQTRPEGTKGIHKLVPIPANEEGKRGDGQAMSCGFGLQEEGRRAASEALL